LPKTDEPANGDAYSTDDRTAALTFLIADGLGHGMAAADASVAAVQAFLEIRAAPLPQIIARAHEALRSTRGAAIGIARIDPEHDRLHFAGIGNIAATVVTGEVTRKTVSLNGTVGHQLRRIQAFDYPFAANSLLVMHSDGLVSSWTLERYPGIQMRHPALIAGVLYRDYTRGRDDVTVLVARRPRL
jgi:serine phosphatase RsbU (regulator of sigma subunit)